MEEEGDDEAAVEVEVEVAVVVVRPTGGGSRGGVSRRRVCGGLPAGAPEAADAAVEAVPSVAAVAAAAAAAVSVVEVGEGDVEVVEEKWGG